MNTALVKPILKEAAAKLEKTFGYMLIAPPALNFPKARRDSDCTACTPLCMFHVPSHVPLPYPSHTP